jgi:group I intron endonuclease
MIFTIYLITNKLSGKVYVGQTEQVLERRWSLHKSRARRNEGYTAHLYNAVRKYGFDSFEIKEIASCNSLEWCNYLETLYILIYDSMNPEIGYNMNSGGNKRVPRPEEIEKARQRTLGRKHPPEFGKHQSEMLIKAWAEGRHTGTRGKKFSPESRQRMAEGHTGQKSPMFLKTICSEELLFLWNSEVPPSKISEHFNISEDTVRRRVRAVGLDYLDHKTSEWHSGSRSSRYKKTDNDLLRKLFFENLSLREIGRRIGIDHHGVSQRIQALGLTRIKQ